MLSNNIPINYPLFIRPMTDEKSVQEKYGSDGVCFGCGPKNEKGLQIRSFPNETGEGLIVKFQPAHHHRAFNDIMNGGIIGTVFDCHQNWTAAMALYKKNPEEHFPSTVTYKFSVTLLKPTPIDQELVVKAKPTLIDGKKIHTEAEMYAGDILVAKSDGIFVSVGEGHPAYHRWE